MVANDRPPTSSHDAASLAILALLLTFLNAIKPMQLDDNAYLAHGQRIAEDPLDPYGFDMTGARVRAGLSTGYSNGSALLFRIGCPHPRRAVVPHQARAPAVRSRARHRAI